MKSKLWRLWTFYLVLVMVVSLFVACAPPKEVEEAASFPIEVTDQLGRVVKLEKVPERIVSLAPSNTEIVFALGLEDRLVGVTTYCDYPEAAKEKPKVGGYSTADMEKVVEIQPDLILAAYTHKSELVPKLETLGFTVIVIDSKTIDEVLESITLIGNCTGTEEMASRLVAEMMNRIKAVTDKTAKLTEAERPRVFYITWQDPLKTVGSAACHDELIWLAGGTNIFHDLTDAYPVISLEAVIDANPEVIIASISMGSGQDLPFQFALSEPRLGGVDARINNRVYSIYPDFFRHGPRIVEGLENLAEFIHPELFRKD